MTALAHAFRLIGIGVAVVLIVAVGREFALVEANAGERRASLLYPRPAEPFSKLSLRSLERWQTRALAHYRGNLRAHRKVAARRPLTAREARARLWLARAAAWTDRELGETRAAIRRRKSAERRAATVGRMIAAGEQVARESDGDPWPNCPDPYDDGGYSWADTVKCENRGVYERYGLAAAWLTDPPGYYCGPLQLDPVIWAHVIRRWRVPC